MENENQGKLSICQKLFTCNLFHVFRDFTFDFIHTPVYISMCMHMLLCQNFSFYWQIRTLIKQDKTKIIERSSFCCFPFTCESSNWETETKYFQVFIYMTEISSTKSFYISRRFHRHEQLRANVRGTESNGKYAGTIELW